MALFARRLDVSPRPLSLARAVADRPGAALLWTAEGKGPSYVACDPIDESSRLDPDPTLGLDPDAGLLGSVPRWIGMVPYEARRGIERTGGGARDARPVPHRSEPLWLRYGAVAKITDRVLVVGDDRSAVKDLSALLSRPAASAGPIDVALAGPIEADEIHHRRIGLALDLIARGEIYEVNVARRMRFRVAGRPVDLLAAMSARAPAAYAAALSWKSAGLSSTSPELCLRVEPDGRIVTAPIKGTRPRGRNAADDERLRLELAADPKERAELAMVVDVERNDLGVVAETGSVRVLDGGSVRTHRTVHHRAALLGARLRRGASRAEVLSAMLPSGSVTGAPKIRAMEIIAELEPHRRGLYTGAYGFIRHDGGLELAMAIRVLSVAGDEGHYFSGGGIVADSIPAREVEETRWKAAQIAEWFHGGENPAVLGG